jgi:hypothetical protein
MKIRTLTVAAVAALAALGLSACGENQQVTVYQQGKYKGKPDTKPWDSPEWGGDKAKWEREINQRATAQNEYARLQ